MRLCLSRRLARAALLLPAALSAFAGAPARADQIAPPVPPRVVLQRKTVLGTPVKVITVNLNSPEVRVTPMLAAGGAGRAESFRAMMVRSAPAAAVTGTFFATNSLLPIGDIVIGGELAHFGGRGAALCLAPDPLTGGTRAVMRANAGLWRHTDWSGCETVLAGGMWLVRDGVLALDPRAQGFRDPSLFRPNPRVAVGLTPAGKLLLVATGKRVTLGRWAKVLRGLGAHGALNLDGGSSTGMFFQGNPVIRPRRHLTNVLVVYSRRAAYDRARAAVAPPPARGYPARRAAL